MQEFSSVIASSYDAESLAPMLTEKAGEGWEVVSIIAAGTNVVAYLRRDGDASGGGSTTASTDLVTTGDTTLVATDSSTVAGVGAGEPTDDEAIELSEGSVAGEATTALGGGIDSDTRSDDPERSASSLGTGTSAVSDDQVDGASSDDMTSTPSSAPDDVASSAGVEAGWADGSGTTSDATPDAGATIPERAAQVGDDDGGTAGLGGVAAGAGLTGGDVGAAAIANDASDTADDATTAEESGEPGSTGAGSATTDDSTTSTVSETTAPASSVPAGWYADPSGRFELRYWDGQAWTEHVSRAGQQYTDPPVA